MNRISLKLLTVCGITCFMACTTTQKPKTEKWSERMARSEMKRFPEPWMIEKASKPRWGYTHGLVVKSMLEEWKHTGDSTYYDYAKIYADSLIDNDGHIRTMKYLSFNIDNVNAGKILFDFYAQTGDERYKIAMDTLRKQMREQPRTSEGGFCSEFDWNLSAIHRSSPPFFNRCEFGPPLPFTVTSTCPWIGHPVSGLH